MSNDAVAEIHDPAQHPVSIGLTFMAVVQMARRLQ